MFKLVKILGKGDSVPEITTINAPITMPIKKGAVYFINGDNICSQKDGMILVKFIPTESLPQGHRKPKVRGYIVTHGMLFEADTDGDFSEKYVGDGITFMEDDNNDLLKITPEEGNDAMIISKDDYERTGKILVMMKQ